jgi:hypothetical protein
MIQRKQSLWLLLLILFSFFLFKGGILNFVSADGQKYYIGFSGVYRVVGSGSEIIRNSISLSVLIIAIQVISLATILLYKSLKIQKIASNALTTFCICLTILVIYYSYSVMINNKCQIVPGIKMIIPVLNLVLAILAFRGISKDETLLKSYDRLR